MGGPSMRPSSTWSTTLQTSSTRLLLCLPAGHAPRATLPARRRFSWVEASRVRGEGQIFLVSSNGYISISVFSGAVCLSCTWFWNHVLYAYQGLCFSLMSHDFVGDVIERPLLSLFPSSPMSCRSFPDACRLGFSQM